MSTSKYNPIYKTNPYTPTFTDNCKFKQAEAEDNDENESDSSDDSSGDDDSED